MTSNTKTTLIDETIAALKSGDEVALKEAFHLVRVKCHQSGVDFLKFLFNEVFPVYAGEEPVKSVECPYCKKADIKGEFGLRTHVSRVHKEKFAEFKSKYL